MPAGDPGGNFAASGGYGGNFPGAGGASMGSSPGGPAHGGLGYGPNSPGGYNSSNFGNNWNSANTGGVYGPQSAVAPRRAIQSQIVPMPRRTTLGMTGMLVGNLGLPSTNVSTWGQDEFDTTTGLGFAGGAGWGGPPGHGMNGNISGGGGWGSGHMNQGMFANGGLVGQLPWNNQGLRGFYKGGRIGDRVNSNGGRFGQWSNPPPSFKSHMHDSSAASGTYMNPLWGSGNWQGGNGGGTGGGTNPPGGGGDDDDGGTTPPTPAPNLRWDWRTMPQTNQYFPTEYFGNWVV